MLSYQFLTITQDNALIGFIHSNEPHVTVYQRIRVGRGVKRRHQINCFGDPLQIPSPCSLRH